MCIAWARCKLNDPFNDLDQHSTPDALMPCSHGRRQHDAIVPLLSVLSCRLLATVSTSVNSEHIAYNDNEVELRRFGGVNTPVGSRDSFTIFLYCSSANHLLPSAKLPWV